MLVDDALEIGDGATVVTVTFGCRGSRLGKQGDPEHEQDCAERSKSSHENLLGRTLGPPWAGVEIPL